MSKGEAHIAPPEGLALSKMKDIYCTVTEGKRKGCVQQNPFRKGNLVLSASGMS